MATVSRGLPERPHLDVPKREARELLNQWRNGDREAFERIRQRHPRFAKSDDSALAAGPFRLNDAQLVIAREYPRQLEYIEAANYGKCGREGTGRGNPRR